MKTDNFKRFMTFSRGERIAIITMVSMIVIMMIAKFIIINNPPKREYFKHDLDSIIARREAVLDSMRRADSIKKGKACLAPKSAACLSIDLNTADTTLFKQLPGIGGAYAKWIVNYREKLGGYCEIEQLLEVYRMDTTRFNGFKNQIKIDSAFVPNKLRINHDAFKVLLKHPYLAFDNVKKIVNHREQKGMIASWEQLVQVVGDAINPKLQYYIDYQ